MKLPILKKAQLLQYGNIKKLKPNSFPIDTYLHTVSLCGNTYKDVVVYNFIHHGKVW